MGATAPSSPQRPDTTNASPRVALVNYRYPFTPTGQGTGRQSPIDTRATKPIEPIRPLSAPCLRAKGKGDQRE